MILLWVYFFERTLFVVQPYILNMPYEQLLST